MVPSDGGRSGWARLFWEAFTHSRNAMVLLDDDRRHVETNGAYLQLLGYRRSDLIGRRVYDFVAGGSTATPREWRAILRRRQFTGVAGLVCADGRCVRVEFAGHPEIVTGRQLVLFVILTNTPRGRRVADGTGTASATASLTPRELEVTHMVALGFNGREVAQELHLAHDTVRTHVRNAMRKMGARSRAQLVAKTLGEGLHLRTDA